MFRAFVFGRRGNVSTAPGPRDHEVLAGFIDFDFRLCENPPHRPFSLM